MQDGGLCTPSEYELRAVEEVHHAADQQIAEQDCLPASRFPAESPQHKRTQGHRHRLNEDNFAGVDAGEPVLFAPILHEAHCCVGRYSSQSSNHLFSPKRPNATTTS